MLYVKNDSNTPQNVFIPRSGIAPETTDVRLQSKDYDITENGDYTITPDQGYEGISSGTISVNVEGPGYDEGYQAGYSEGYSSGETDGAQTQKAKLTSVTLTTNTSVFREDGYSAVTVNVSTAETYQEGYEDGYTSGYTEGGAAQKALLSSETFTNNGVYQRENGLNEIIVSVPPSGATPILINHEFTENGEYRPPFGVDGWSSVTINYNETPAYNSGYTQGYTSGYTSGQTDGYSSGYTSGQTDGYTSGYTEGENTGYSSGVTDGEAAQKALLGATSFTENNTYTNVNGWSAVTVNVSGGGGSSLTSETFTTNGNYSPVGADGWSAITINVSSSTGTNIPLTAITAQEFAANNDTTYQFIRTSADTLHRLVITFPTSGTTKVTAKYFAQADGDVKLYSILPVNSITIDDGEPIGPTTSVTMTAGEHNVVFDCSRDDLWGGLASFHNCTALTEINLNGAYVETMPDFQGCTSLRKIEAERCESVGNYRCWATDIDILVRDFTPLLKKVGTESFKDCQSLQFSDIFLTEIGFGAFNGCSMLSSVELRSATTIGSQAFDGCALESIELDSECTIGSSAFKNCPMTNGVAFVNNKTRTVYYTAFSGCTGLTQIYSYDGARPPIVVDGSGQTSNALVGVPASGTIEVSTTSIIQDWTTWAATYLPGWTVQQA